MSPLKFLVVCPKSQDWMSKICIASIRYFYPDNEIFYIKDDIQGEFSISDLEKYWSVKEMRYNTSFFGMSGAKMFFYADPVQEEDLYLVLDADIVLLGKLPLNESNADVIVSAEYEANPNQQSLRDLYFEINRLTDIGYQYPGYFFNAGQIFCKRGFLHDRKNELAKYFDFENFPRWKRLDILPRCDQSFLNMYLPMMEKDGKLTIAKENFMIWTGWDIVNKWTLDEIKNGQVPFLLHYAGAFRDQYLKKMIRPDILYFFQDFYYSRIPGGKFKLFIGEKYFIASYYFRQLIIKIRRIIKV
jgi:hypothetical protein